MTDPIHVDATDSAMLVANFCMTRSLIAALMESGALSSEETIEAINRAILDCRKVVTAGTGEKAASLLMSMFGQVGRADA